VISGVSLYQFPNQPQSLTITVPSVSKSGLQSSTLGFIVLTVPGCQVPPKAGETFLFEGCADPADR